MLWYTVFIKAMLTPYVNSQFVEKVFTDRAGRQFRMVFLVALVNGEVKGRLVSVQPLAQESFKNTAEVICLPIICPKNETVTEYIAPTIPVVSPYNELFFFTSQPTRAPSQK